MKFLFVLLSVLTLASSCAHKTKAKTSDDVAVTDKVHEFDNHCAMSICLKKGRVPCNTKITHEYKGKAYCFSSDTARDAFLKDVDKNAARAHEQWAESGAASGRR